ncbi:unnamed protein product [Moneuplotes crassus]|uniref:Penicillin amidase n=1 Tax=Euplotes crassus TaxID=5936 RepID=A0AAD2D9L5_EUPCR|nr:unnamed protein product [Moneuplotes crassus]
MWIFRWILYLAVAITAICLALLEITHPKYNGKVKISSKYGNVTVYRTDDGIPHIYGDNKEAAYFGLGYIQAQDRLWSFQKFRLLAKAQLSEYFGDEGFPIDYFFKQMNLDYLAQVAVRNISQELKEDISLVAEGINEYIKTQPLPIEFWILGVDCAPFTLTDILEIEKLMDFAVSYNHQMELSRDFVFKSTNSSTVANKYMPFEDKYFRNNQYPTFDDEQIKKLGLFEKDGLKNRVKNFKPRHTNYKISKKDIYEEVKETLGMVHFDGSNAWAVHGNYTESGKPILSTDPHLASSLPCAWFMGELSYENVTRVGAFSFGQPWLMFGRTDHISTAITAIHSDVIDLYEEKVTGDGFYEFDGELIPIKQQKDIIKVRDPFAPSGYRIEEIILNSTHHGPLIDDPHDEIYKILKRLPFGAFKKNNLAISWSGFQGKSTYFGNNRCLNLAKDVPEGIECFRELGTSNLNIFMADRKGNIGMIPSVSYPIRKHPYAGAYVQDGSKSENDWQGFVPFDELPKAINPKRGYIANSNSMLTTTNVKYGVGATMPSPPRVVREAQLIEAQIKSGKKFTAKDMLKIQLDTVDLNAREMLVMLKEVIDVSWPRIMEQFNNRELKIILSKFRKHLNDWDGDYHVNSTQASLFALWEMEYHVSLLQDQIPHSVIRETMINIPDSDLYLMEILEHLMNDPTYYSEYCQSSITIYEKTYEIKSDNCLMSLAYNAVRAWKILEKTVSKDPNDWKWGSLHRHYYDHFPFSIIPGFKQIFHREVEAGGSRRTVSFACYDYYLNNMEDEVFFKSIFSANFRGVIDMASYDDPEKYPLYMSIDTGASQHAFSKHYFDMNKIHYSKEGRIMEIGKDVIAKKATYKFEIEV